MSDDTKGWVQENAVRILLGALMLLVSVVGWGINSTLTKVENSLDVLNLNVQGLMQNREAMNARMLNAESMGTRNADRIRELERQVWKHDFGPETPSSP